MPAEKYSFAAQLPHDANGISKSRAIALGVSRPGRTEPPSLPKRQIETQHGETGIGKRFGHRDQKRGIGICAGAVRKHEAMPGTLMGTMNRARDAERVIVERFDDSHGS